LISEFPDEPMVQTALDLRTTGTIVSLEPLLASAAGPDWEGMLALIQHVTIVTPDWPSASRIAKSDEPLRVLRYWSTLGPDVIAVRHGAHGSYIWSRDHDEAWHVPPVPTEVVDPTGAGNAYGGGLVVGWTETGDARIAGNWGAISASVLVRHVGLPRMSIALQHHARTQASHVVALARRL
jgi:sugar/nucleoside kinase (ribokinase family)